MNINDMTKRLFSLTILLGLAIGLWADNVATFSSQTVWTADQYSGSDFGTDTDHAASLSGTFSGTSVNWEATKVLTCGANASIAFGHTGSGKLYVVYGSTTNTDGIFSIKHQGSDETEATSLYEETMAGIDYTGPLGAPETTRSPSDYKFTQAEAVVSLSGAGTVYLSGTQPYCIYAILFVPTYDDYSIYSTNDFRTWAMDDTHVAKKGKTVGIELANGYMTGKFIGDGVGTDPNMTLNYAFTLTGTTASNVTIRRNDNTSSGLWLNNSPATLTIKRLKAGDWFTIQYTGVLKFEGTNQVCAAGSSTLMSDGDAVKAGTIYLVQEDGDVSLAFGAKSTNSYIFSIQLSNEDAISPPVITVDANDQVTIDGGTSLKGNAVTVYYTTDGSDPTASETRQQYTAPFTATETVKVRADSVLKSDETVVSTEAEPLVIRIGTWTGKTNVFDFASAAKNFVDITFGDTKLDGIKMYGGSSSQNADANFYEITNT